MLRCVGQTIAETARESDACARIGGEEFAILLPDTDEQGAYLAAERLRDHIQRACSDLPGELTISVGVATFPQHGREGDGLMRAADQAVYMAKQLGRDRTVLFDPETASALADVARRKRPDHERQLATALRLAEALDIRDAGTAAHSQTVARYAEGTARALGLSPERCERVRYAGIVHDVGKIGVDDAILCKPRALDPGEEAEMRKHPQIGARILAGSDLSDISSWVVAHHERPDGTGYPLGLRHDEIPIEALILGVADAYEAMTNDRPFRSAMAPVAAQNELIRGVGQPVRRARRARVPERGRARRVVAGPGRPRRGAVSAPLNRQRASVPQHAEAVAPGQLLALFVLARLVGDRHLEDALALLEQPGGDLGLDREAALAQRQRLEDVGPDRLVAGHDVRQVDVEHHVRRERHAAVAHHVHERVARVALERADAEDRVGLAVEQRRQQPGRGRAGRTPGRRRRSR